MLRLPRIASSFAAAALIASTVHAVDHAGFLTVNDEDYGYWEGRVMVFDNGSREPIDSRLGDSMTQIDLQLGHDLTQGLVRQFAPRKLEAPSSTSGSDEATSVARGAKPSQPPREGGEWFFLADFTTFGFGQYEGSDPTLSVYCSDSPAVWVWLAGAEARGATPEELANRVVQDEHEMARLRIRCGRPMTVAP